MAIRYISINSKLYSEEDAKIAVSDLSIQRGYGIFDFLKTINGKPIFIENHLNRFYNSAKEMNLEVELDRQSLTNAVNELMAQNNIPNSGIKIILTGGFSEDGYTLHKPNLIITQVPFEINDDYLYKGLALASYNHQRQLASVKTIDYLQAIRLQPYLKEKKADDLLYHADGEVREAPRANFFIVKENKVITPKTAILSGITRSKILSLQIEGYTIVEQDFKLEEALRADEAFVSSSTKNAYPVISVDGQKIGTGKIGPVTRLINEKLFELIKQS